MRRNIRNRIYHRKDFILCDFDIADHALRNDNWYKSVFGIAVPTVNRPTKWYKYIETPKYTASFIGFCRGHGTTSTSRLDLGYIFLYHPQDKFMFQYTGYHYY